MPLISLEEAFDGEVDASTSRYTFKGRSSSADDTIESIKASPMCPKEGNTDPYNPSKIITGVQVTRMLKETKGPFWLITMVSALQETPAVNPLDAPAAITLHSEQYEGLTIFDNKGKAIVNKAGSIIPVPIEMTRWIFQVKKNVPFLPNWILSFANAINSGQVNVQGLACPAKTLMMKSINSSEVQSVQYGASYIEYVTISFSLYYREEGWEVPYPNVGFDAIFDNEKIWLYEIGPSGRKSSKIKLDPKTKQPMYRLGPVLRKISEGPQPETPYILTQDGRLNEDQSPNQIIKLKAPVYPERDFNLLPLR